MQTANRVAKNTGILYVKMAITVFISLYSTRLILSALGAKDFGLFSLVGGAIAMLGFLNASMAGTTQRFMSFAQGAGDFIKINKIFNMSVLLHLVIAIIIFLILEIAGYFFFHGILNIEPARLSAAKWIYQFMIISTLFTVISVPYDALLNAHENMLFFAVLGILESFLKLGIALYITHISADKLLYYGALTASLSIILLITNRIYCHRRYPETKIAIRALYDKILFKEMTGFAGWSLLGSSSSMIASYGQGIVINMFFGTLVNAAQGVANQVSGQLGAFAATMLKALYPVIAKSEGAGNRELMLKTAMLGGKISFFLSMFFFVPILIEMPYVFKIWLKEVPEYAIIFCQLYFIRNLIDQMFVTISATISAVGNIRRYQIFTSILNFSPLIISFILFKLGYPPYVMYFVFIAYSITIASFNIYFSKIYCSLPIIFFFKHVVFRSLFSFILVFLISYIPKIFLTEGVFRLLIVLTINLISFIVITYAVGFSIKERSKLHQLLNEIIHKINFKLKT